MDATLGGGGHSIEILQSVGEKGRLVAIDMDEAAIERFKSKIKNQKSKFWKNVFLINRNFADLENILGELKIEKVNAVLADLGWSSDQLQGRGMSFMKDEPLDMRLNRDQENTAKKIVDGYSQKELERILKEYGEEKFARNIARNIIEYRKNKTIETTRELAEIIEKTIPKRFQKAGINLATRTFQALRIEVNNELENLEKFIPLAIEVLAPEGRLVVISFHSLEDRIVKNIFRQNARGCICPNDFPECRCGKSPKIKIITKKPIIPEENELKINPRSRSAKLRICEKISTNYESSTNIRITNK